MNLETIKPAFQIAAVACLAMAAISMLGIAPTLKVRPDTVCLVGILCALVGK